MSTMILDRVEQAERLESFIGDFREAISETNIQELRQKKIDKKLDYILERQKYLKETNAEFEERLPRFHQFLWYVNPEKEVLANIKKLFGLMNELARQMQIVYQNLNEYFYKNQISRADLMRYREYAFQLKEVAVDLENRFFALPADDDFMDIMQQLEDL